MMKFKKGAALILAAILAFCVLTFVLSLNGIEIRIVHVHKKIGIPSPNGQYRLVEMTDQTQQYLLYSVISVGNAYPKTEFVTEDFWFHSRYIKDYGWIEGTNDFYIDSSDSGRILYQYDDGVWKNEWAKDDQ